MCATAFGFVPQNARNLIVSTPQQDRESAAPVILFSEDSKQKKGGLETGMRSKLVSESIAPWRTLRLFLYGSLGSGAFIGGLINTSGAIAGSNRPEFNLNTEVGIHEVVYNSGVA